MSEVSLATFGGAGQDRRRPSRGPAEETLFGYRENKTTMVKIKGLRWWMISLVMLGSVINYLTRSTLAVAAPTILEDLHITEREYSWIVGAFQGAIMLQPVCGYVLDVLGLKLGPTSTVIPRKALINKGGLSQLGTTLN